MSVAAVATAPEAIAGDSKHVAVKAIDDLLQRILEFDPEEESEDIIRTLQQEVTIVMGACNAQAKRDMPDHLDNHHTHTTIVQGEKAAQNNPHVDTMQFIGTAFITVMNVIVAGEISCPQRGSVDRICIAAFRAGWAA